MRTVHIYVESECTAPKSMERWMGYVLEYRANENTYTKEAFYKDMGTYHAVILRALTKAVKRVTEPCELHIHTKDSFVLDMTDECLPYWAVNGYRTAKGELVKNHFEWKALFEASANHLIAKEPGMHSYFYWMMGEIEKRKKEGKDREEKHV